MKKGELGIPAGIICATLLIGSMYFSTLLRATRGEARYFPETGHNLTGRFLTYWEGHGELMQQGYPISEPFQRVDSLSGKLYTVQYFERAVFEYHPANAGTPFDVLLTLLGVFEYQRRYGPVGASQQHVSTDNPRFFPETQHSLGGKFRTYWESHGGLMQQGYPISDEFQEQNASGDTYIVQYFQRAVFELHPENAGTPDEVLLALLGAQQYQALQPAILPSATILPTPPPRPSWRIESVSMVSASEGWAVGHDVPNYRGLLLHYSAGRWSQVHLPVLEGLVLNAVTMVSANEGWAISVAGVLHYRAGQWNLDPNYHLAGDPIYSVSMASAEEGWAVGGDDSPLVLHYLQGQWSEDSVHGTMLGGYALDAVSSTANGDAWAAGTNGMTLKRTGLRDWLEMTTPTTEALFSIFAVSGEEAWAGGYGPILHYSAGQWLQMPLPPPVDGLKRIRMVSGDEGWAVGGAGTIIHYTDGNWVPVPLLTDGALNDLYMVSPTEGWAVGEQGTILHYQDGNWQPYSP